MSDTFLSKNIGSIYAGVGTPKGKTKPYPVGESGIYPGYHCVVTSGKWMLGNQSDERVGAIVGNITSITTDLDTAMTYSATLSSCSMVEGYSCGMGDRVYAWYGSQSPAVDLTKGMPMAQSSTEGLLAKFVYADGTDHTDTFSEVVGRLWDDAITGSVTANQIIELVLNN
jgi:hypothetical protein